MLNLDEQVARRAAIRNTIHAIKTRRPVWSLALGLVVLMIGLTGFFECHAQSGSEATNGFVLLLADNTQAKLPLETGVMKYHAKAIGIAGGKSYTEISGRQAAVRLQSGQPQTFLMFVDSEIIAGNPMVLMGLCQLHKLDVDKRAGTRQDVHSDITGYGPIAKHKAEDYRGIPLNFSHYDAHFVKVEPRSPLPPGEYAFRSATGVGPTDPYGSQNQFYFYCFGVD